MSRRDQLDVARRVAVCDLGSNTFRMVVFRSGDGHWRRTDEIFEPVRIAAGMSASGHLDGERIERALATVGVFDHFCRAGAIEEVDAVATSAIRDAVNSDELIGRASLPIRIASTAEEARYGYLAAVNSTTLADGGVLDIGGGSIQIVRVASRHDVDSGSWALGAVRMTERFSLAENGVPRPGQIKKLRAHVTKQLAEAEWIGRCGPRLVGIGGTVRSLAAAAQRARQIPALGVQGYLLRADEIDELIERLAAVPAGERSAATGVKADRGDVILAGAIVLRSVLDAAGADAIEVTEAGLREGVFFSHHLGGDPPLFDDVRRDSILNIAAHYGADDAHTEHVVRLALTLFDRLADGGLHAGDRHERELLWAAATLHDIGMAVGYDDHHRHSRYLVHSSTLAGFSQREAALIGQIVFYHRKGQPSLGGLAPLATDGDPELLLRCAVLLRLAEGLERSRDQVVRGLDVTVGANRAKLELEAPDDPAVAVARWAAGREGELFEQAFGRELSIR